jgi:hypothetical protein
MEMSGCHLIPVIWGAASKANGPGTVPRVRAVNGSACYPRPKAYTLLLLVGAVKHSVPQYPEPQ